MSFLLGGKKTQSVTPTKYIGIPVQTSIKGNAIPKGWGTFKCPCNMLDYLAFTAISHTEKQGGKGGGYKSTSYTYTASIILGLCQGPISGIRKVWKDQAVFTGVGGAGLSLATGAVGQGVWGYLTTNFPAHAIGYSNLAYVYAANYALNDSATIANHTFEVQSPIRQIISGSPVDDANAADILDDFFGDLPVWWPTTAFPSPTDFHDYTLAMGLLISPVLDNQRGVSDFLTEIFEATNSDCLWTDGELQIVPYGDESVTGNGVTWNPNLTPVYDLQWGNFLAAEGDDPIKWNFKRPPEAYNKVQIEFLDRNANYNTDIAPAIDPANSDQFGPRIEDPVSLHCICDAAVAAKVAQIRVQRTANVRRTATFELPELFGLINPMDLLTLPLRDGGRRLVRVVDYEEKPDGASIVFNVEEMLVGVGAPAALSRQTSSGASQDQNIDPGDCGIPAIFDVPVQLAEVLGLETWIGISSVAGNPAWGGAEIYISTDNVTYVRQTTILGGTRMGALSATFPVGADPDTVNTLAIDLTRSLGTLTSGSVADADNGTTICFVDGEYVSYTAATLTGAFQYDLDTYLRRGQWGSNITSHAIGSLFVRLDESVGRIPFNATDVGRTIWIKQLSFNVFGQHLQDLASVTAYPHTIGGPPTIYAPVGLTAVSVPQGVELKWVNPPNVGIAAIEIWRSASAAYGGATHIADAGGYATSYIDQDVLPITPYWYWIRPRDIAGTPGDWTPSIGGPGATETTGAVASEFPSGGEPSFIVNSIFQNLAGAPSLAGWGNLGTGGAIALYDAGAYPFGGWLNRYLGNQTGRDVYYGLFFPVTEDQVYFLQAGQFDNGSGWDARMGLYFVDGNFAAVTWGEAWRTANGTTGFGKAGQVVVPAGAVYAMVWMGIDNGGAISGSFYYTQMLCRKSPDSNMLVDGSVATPHVQDNAINQNPNQTTGTITISTGPGNSVTVASVSMTQAFDVPVQIVVDAQAHLTAAYDGSVVIGWTLKRDGATVASTGSNAILSQGGSVGIATGTATFRFIAEDGECTPGAHTYTVEASGSDLIGNTGYPLYTPIYGTVGSVSDFCNLNLVYPVK